MIDDKRMQALRGIGFAPALISSLALLAPTDTEATLMRVVEVQREGLALHDGHSEHAARLQPALRNSLAADDDAIACGDWVLASCNTYGEWWVHTRLPPLNQLARRLHDGRDKVTRVVIVSNVDTALLVMGLDGDFNLRRLERYAALVRMAGVAAVVVLSKRDLVPDAAARLQQAQAVLPAEVAVLAVNALDDDTRPQLAPWLQPGQTLVLLGSSGAGKSTLTNTLTGANTGSPQGAAPQATGGTREGDGRGRHTTTVRSLHATPMGACIIDTPGLRTLRLDGDAAGLDAAFDDIARLAPLCRFRDCQHEAEPGCAVREGVSAERLRNYRKLQREARRDTLTALDRKVQVQQWKARGRQARERLQQKRG